MNSERTPVFLMANLGTEVFRILTAEKQGDQEAVLAANSRAQNILDALKENLEMYSREGELTLLSTALSDYISDNKKLAIKGTSLRAYFLPFMIRATMVSH
ncbi:MAG: hypothetical protein AAB682_02770 [Patescibacteria group bacterium]